MGETVPVAVEDFTRAETDRYLRAFSQGRVGELIHHREPANADNQRVVRDNPNVLGTVGVFDLDAGPVPITLPDAGERFLSLMTTSEDHYTATVYDPGVHELTRDGVGTRYVFVAVRILVDPSDADDVAEVHALQDAIVAEQPGGPGALELPDWDQASLTALRDALIVLGNTLPDGNRTFGTREQVDPIRHLLGTAMGWGGNNERDAFYVLGVPEDGSGETSYELTLRDLPIDSWWGVSVYNHDGYFEKNDREIYTINSVGAVPNADGSFTVRFGGDAGDAPNVLPIFPGWNYAVRLYRPHPEVTDGRWTLPRPSRVG